MFRSAGSSQPAGRHYSVFGHLLNRASRTLPPIMSCHYVGRVISHQFLSVVFFTGTIPYLSVPVLETLRFRFWYPTFFFRHHGLFGRYPNRGFRRKSPRRHLFRYLLIDSRDFSRGVDLRGDTHIGLDINVDNPEHITGTLQYI